MRATGLDHRTRELAGLHRTTTAADSLWGTGRGSAAILNTITDGITIEAVTSTIMADMVITTTTETIDSGHGSEPLCGFGGAHVDISKRGIERLVNG